MKKILLLGGSTQQIVAIEYAKKQGYYTVLCDYLKDNPGQYQSDKFYLVSTTDKEAVLEVAIQEEIDAIVAYASDPATPTAGFVAEKLNLPSNPYQSIMTLAYKHNFRRFLTENNFNCPKWGDFYDFDSAKKALHQFKFPLFLKPVDSSGSKGITQLKSEEAFEEAFELALSHSRSKHVIIEECILKSHRYMVGGDCFILNGKVEYWGLLNTYRDEMVDPLVPTGASYPVEISSSDVSRVHEEIEKMVDLLDLQFGGFNIELYFDKTEALFMIEFGPRNGGNMIPDLLKMATGVDMTAAAVEAALGHTDIILKARPSHGFYATHILHSSQSGVLKAIQYSERLSSCIVDAVLYKKEGDPIEYFDASNKALGVLMMKFDSKSEMDEILENINKEIFILLE